jgi:hypothetical protein
MIVSQCGLRTSISLSTAWRLGSCVCPPPPGRSSTFQFISRWAPTPFYRALHTKQTLCVRYHIVGVQGIKRESYDGNSSVHFFCTVVKYSVPCYRIVRNCLHTVPYPYRTDLCKILNFGVVGTRLLQ